MQNNEVVLSQILSNASLPSFHQVYESGLDSRKTHKCCVYIADESKYFVRLNSIQAFMDVNRDVSCFLINVLHTWIPFTVYFFQLTYRAPQLFKLV